MTIPALPSFRVLPLHHVFKKCLCHRLQLAEFSFINIQSPKSFWPHPPGQRREVKQHSETGKGRSPARRRGAAGRGVGIAPIPWEMGGSAPRCAEQITCPRSRRSWASPGTGTETHSCLAPGDRAQPHSPRHRAEGKAEPPRFSLPPLLLLPYHPHLPPPPGGAAGPQAPEGGWSVHPPARNPHTLL